MDVSALKNLNIHIIIRAVVRITQVGSSVLYTHVVHIEYFHRNFIYFENGLEEILF